MTSKPTYEEFEQRIAELEGESSKLKRAEAMLQARVKELNCLHGMSALLELPGISFDEILKKTVMLLPPSWQFPEITEPCIVLEGQTFQTANFRETSWMQAREIIVHGKPVGQVEVCNLERAKLAFHNNRDQVKYSIHDARTPAMLRFFRFLDAARARVRPWIDNPLWGCRFSFNLL